MSYRGFGLCRTCEYDGCCEGLPHCGGKYWVSAWDDDEEENGEEEGEEEDGDGEDGDGDVGDGDDGDDV